MPKFPAPTARIARAARTFGKVLFIPNPLTMKKLLFFLAAFLLLSYAAFRIFFYIDHRSEEKQVAENEHSLRLTPSQLDSLQEGDIILRRGYGIFSDMIAKRLNDGRFDVTHSGILYRKNGNWWVIHSLSSDVSNIDGMQEQPLNAFLKYSMPEKILIVRPLHSTPEQGRAVVQRAKHYLKAQIPFDHLGTIDEPSQLYCTELIYQILDNDLHFVAFPTDKTERQQLFTTMTTLYNPKYFEIIINTYPKKQKTL